jgi:hypothetical protein
MGDSRLRVWDRRGNEVTSSHGNVLLDGTERWSTARGPVGHPHVARSGLADVRRVAAYSDGLALLDSSLLEFASLDQLDTAAMEGAAASGDDASILIVDLLPNGV